MRTALSAVIINDVWRAEITWPNGAKNYFGKFPSEAEATKWIAWHRWLAEQEMEPKPAKRPRGLQADPHAG
jgi:hypothetical protein